MSKQRVIAVFVGYYLPHLGGVETYTQKLVNELIKLGYKILIVTSNHDNLPEYEEKGNLKIFRLPILKLFSARYPLFKKSKNYKKILSRVMDEKIDYIISNTRFHLSTFIGIEVAKEKKIPILLIEHGSSHFTIGNKVLDSFGAIYEHQLTNKLKKNIDYFYGVSEKCNEWLKHFGIEADGVFYNSVDKEDCDKYKNKHYLEKNNKTLIVYAGRMIKEKGVEELLKAYEGIKKIYPETKLVLAGDGPILEEMRRKYQDEQVEFVGRLNHEQVMALLNDADIFVYPSMFPEGLPTSVLEAGLMKCAVIATDRGGTKEVINDDKYGMIVEENSESIRKALEKMLKDPNRRRSIGNNLSERIKRNFTWNVTARKVAERIDEK